MRAERSQNDEYYASRVRQAGQSPATACPDIRPSVPGIRRRLQSNSERQRRSRVPLHHRHHARRLPRPGANVRGTQSREVNELPRICSRSAALPEQLSQRHSLPECFTPGRIPEEATLTERRRPTHAIGRSPPRMDGLPSQRGATKPQPAGSRKHLLGGFRLAPRKRGAFLFWEHRARVCGAGCRGVGASVLRWGGLGGFCPVPHENHGRNDATTTTRPKIPCRFWAYTNSPKKRRCFVRQIFNRGVDKLPKV